MRWVRSAVLAWAVAGWVVACGHSDAPPVSDAPSPAAGSSASARPVTYNHDVAPILFTHCATCHRPIENPPAGRAGRSSSPDDPLCVAGAPFSVLEYASVKPRAGAIAAAVMRRVMPPWLPEAGHGAFVNERRLAPGEVDLIQRWAAQGASEGDGEPPVPPASHGGWQLGTPDLVLTLSQPFVLPAGGGDVFRSFVIPVSIAATRYVRGVEFRADNPRVLHHANLALDPARAARVLDRADAGPGFANMPGDDVVQNVYGWSPGKVPVFEPADTGWAIDPGADLVVQLHMVSSASPEPVQPMIGLFFADSPPTREPIVVKLESKAIDIPAGEASYVIEDSYVLPVDADAVSVYPHAHYLAKEMRGTATRPDGTVTPLIWIRQWDVRWQDQYRYRSPLFLPKGTTLSMRFTYDNSAANPNNRHRPPQRIQWGPLSTDEMGALWLEVVPRRAADAAALAADYFRRSRQADLASAELKVRTNPRDAAALNLLAMKYAQAGRVADAQARLEQALRLNPDHAEARSNLGTVLQAQGRFAEAAAHLREAVRLKPSDDRIRFNLGNGLLAAGQVEEAMRELQIAVTLNPENADAHFNLAMLLGPRNRVDEAIVHLRRAIEINPRNGDAYRNLAVAYGLQGRIDEGIQAARHAVRLMPQSPEAREQLDRLLAAPRR